MTNTEEVWGSNDSFAVTRIPGPSKFEEEEQHADHVRNCIRFVDGRELGEATGRDGDELLFGITLQPDCAAASVLRHLGVSLAECRALFPGSVLEMISVAEESGRLDELSQGGRTLEDVFLALTGGSS